MMGDGVFGVASNKVRYSPACTDRREDSLYTRSFVIEKGRRLDQGLLKAITITIHIHIQLKNTVSNIG